MELDCLPLQRRDAGAALLAQRLLREELSIQENIGKGRFRLVGDIRDKGLDLVLFRLQIPGGDGGGRQIPSQLGLHGGEEALVVVLFGEALGDGLFQHIVQPLQNPPGPPAVPDHHGGRRQNSGGNYDDSDGRHVTSPPRCSRCRTLSSDTGAWRAYPPACPAAA